MWKRQNGRLIKIDNSSEINNSEVKVKKIKKGKVNN